MNAKEFSDGFDTLLNSYAVANLYGEEATKSVITLDEYEKSLFLTQAQDLITKSYFYGGDSMGAFDGSEKRQVDFSNLISVDTGQKISGVDFDDLPQTIDRNGIIFTWPKNILFILNERIRIDGKDYVVKPIHYREYDREKSKSYGQPMKKQVWRLTDGNFPFEPLSKIYKDRAYVELISREDTDLKHSNSYWYQLRYVRRPKPIILAKFPSGLTIEGQGEPNDPVCELDQSLHFDILSKAVELAFATRGGVSGTHEKPKEKTKED